MAVCSCGWSYDGSHDFGRLRAATHLREVGVARAKQQLQAHGNRKPYPQIVLPREEVEAMLRFL